MKVVFDTNVLISAFVFKGISLQVYRHCIEQGTLLTSDWIQAELERVLVEKFKFSASETTFVLTLVKEKANLITPNTELPTICRDPDDNNVLQLAESAYADYIITGDKDLLVIEDYKGIRIMTPRQFIEEVIS